MADVTFDPVVYKNQQRAIWDAVSPAWEATSEAFERGAAPVTAKLLELGGVHEGQSVLDIATGHGEPALTVAAKVGHAGKVVGTDIAPGMVAIARRRAKERGFEANVTFVEAEIETLAQLDETFDVVLSRFGLIFAADHVAAFQVAAGRLVPGGVLAFATWGPQESHRMSLGPGRLSELLGMPAPKLDAPGPFSMTDPERVGAELSEAGFVDVSFHEVIADYWFASVEEYVAFNRTVLPPPFLDGVRERFGSVDATEAWQAVGDAVREYAAADGALALPSAAWCVRAVKPY